MARSSHLEAGRAADDAIDMAAHPPRLSHARLAAESARRWLSPALTALVSAALRCRRAADRPATRSPDPFPAAVDAGNLQYVVLHSDRTPR